MQSLIKKTLKAIIWVAIAIVLLLLIFSTLIRIPGIQNRIVHSATSFASNKTHSRIDIENISISFPKSVVIEGLFVEDLLKDTLIYFRSGRINVSFKDLLFKKITIKSFALENAILKVNRIATDSLFNINFIPAAFRDTTKQKKDKSHSKSKWIFSLDNVRFKKLQLLYEDRYAGMDASAFLCNLEMKMEMFDPVESIYEIDELLIENMNAALTILKMSDAKKKSENALPEITANKIRIDNSNVIFGDSTKKQSVIAKLNLLELINGSAAPEKRIISFDKFSLSKSEIRYNTTSQVTPSGTSVPATIAKTESNWIVYVKMISLDENIFAWQVGSNPELKNTFDINNQIYNKVTLEAKDLSYSSDSAGISIKKFSAVDQNNFSIAELETDFRMDRNSLTAKDLRIKTLNSLFVADLQLRYPSLKSLKDSIGFVFLTLNIEDVSFENSDFLYFSPELKKLAFFKDGTNITSVSGNINGMVNDLKGDNMVISTGEKTFLKTSFRIKGLPEVESAYFSFPDFNLTTGKHDIVMIAGSSIPDNIELPENINMKVVFKGKIKSFESDVAISSSYGSANIFAAIDEKENFRTRVRAAGFNLGLLLKDTVMFGPVTLTADAAGHGLDKNMIEAKINADVSELFLNKYNYHNLSLNGNISGPEFEGGINLNDENAVFDFNGHVNLKRDQESFKFSLNLKGADLQKLHFTKNDIRIGLVAAADLKGGSVGNINGSVGVSDVIVSRGEKIYLLDSLLFVSVNEPGRSEFNFTSAIIGVKYSGNISPADISVEFFNFINNYFPFSDTIQLKNIKESSNFNFEIQLHNHPILSQVILPQLKEFEPGVIQVSFDSRKNDLKLQATMNKIVYGATEIEDLIMDVNSDHTSLNCSMSAGTISNSLIKLDNFLVDMKLAGNTIFAKLSSIDDNQNKKLLLLSQITRGNANYRLALDTEEFYLMNDRWHIAADNFIEFGKEGFLIHKFFIHSDESQINIASVNDRFEDDLNISIKNFKLDDISRIIEKDTSLAGGIVDGNVLLKRVNKKYGLIADVKISNLVVREIPVGNLSVKADNPIPDKFDVNLNLSGQENNLTASGFFIPDAGGSSMSINTSIKSLSLKTIEAFSMGLITESSGTLSGNLLIAGAPRSPDITGDLVFNDVFLNPSVLNTRLELKHETLNFADGGIYFKSFTLLDSDHHTAIIDGKVQTGQFKNFIFDLAINTEDFQLINTTVKDNKEFYGRMVIDSRIEINGPMALPVVNGRLKMKNGSNFTFAVPENKLTTDRGEDVVEFEDSLKLNSILFKNGKTAVQKSIFRGYDLSSVIEIDKLATLRLLLDPSSNDSLVVRGEAALSFSVDRSGKISLTGAYNLAEGSYLVSLESFVKRRFEIIPGSTIIWNGDPVDAEITINAKYTVRAGPYDLVAGQMSGLSDSEKDVYKQRYPFWVLLKLRGEILHPVISFEIELPPESKGILGGAVNQKLRMLNEDESALNKQVFALLVLGRFVQENPLHTESGGTSVLVRSTVSSFLSAQLNKLSSKIVPGAELNFDVQSYNDYQTGEAKGRTQVEVGIKKELFNERFSVQVGGIVDVEGERAKQNSASEITGDVKIELKLTEDGRYRMKAFRINQYEGVIEGQLVETGVGIVYVRDFMKWREFFKAPKRKK